MRVLRGEGLASHTSPELCLGDRKESGEAVTMLRVLKAVLKG